MTFFYFDLLIYFEMYSYEYLGNEEQGECDGDGHMGVRKGEQQHPIRMERGKSESEGHREDRIMSHGCSVFLL